MLYYACYEFHVLSKPWAHTTSLYSPCLQALSYILCPSLAAGSHLLSQPCCHSYLLSPEVGFQITQMLPSSLSLTFLLHSISSSSSRSGWRAVDRECCDFCTHSQQEASVHTCCQCWLLHHSLTGQKKFPEVLCNEEMCIVEASI